MTNVAVTCPECGTVATVNVYRESYGQDADGRRGVMTTFAEIATPCKSDCELTDEQFEAVEGIAIESFNRTRD